MPNQGSLLFVNEEVSSERYYGSRYLIRTPDEQAQVMRQWFTTIVTTLPPLPESPGAEGFFVVPHWKKIAPTYARAVERALEALASQRGALNNGLRNWLDSRFFRRSERTARMMEWLTLHRGEGDLLIIPAQFGVRHRGRSPRRARQVFSDAEFGLGPYEVACMLLSHSQRLCTSADLWIDCPGAELSSRGDGDFDLVPCFTYTNCGTLGVSARWSCSADKAFGSVTAFLPR